MIALWVIPMIPLAGFVLNGLLGTRLGKSFVSAVGVGSAGLATLAAYSRLIPYLSSGGGTPMVEPMGSWIVAGSLSIDLSFRLDPLSALMLSSTSTPSATCTTTRPTPDTRGTSRT